MRYYTSKHELELLARAEEPCRNSAAWASLAYMMVARKWIDTPELVEPLDADEHAVWFRYDELLSSLFPVRHGSLEITHRAIKFHLTALGRRVLAANATPFGRYLVVVDVE